MKQYAINDRAVVAKIYFHMYPAEADSYWALVLQIIRTVITDLQNDLSDISEDELIMIIIKPPEINELNSPEQVPVTHEAKPTKKKKRQIQMETEKPTAISKHDQTPNLPQVRLS